MRKTALLFLAGFSFMPATATAGQQFNMDFLSKSAKTIEQAEKQKKPSWLKIPAPTDQQKKEAAKFLRNASKSVNKTLGVTAKRKDAIKAKKAMRNRQIVIAITLSSKFDIKNALNYLKSYKDDKQVRMALAGLPNGCKTFQCAAGVFNKLDVGHEYPPVTLDPKLFKEKSIKVAPTMLFIGKDGNEVARVEGLINPDWLREQVKDGKRGDLGVRGPVVDIEEKNLMDEIAARINRIDQKKAIARAKADYWAKKKYVGLTRATEDREFMFEPIVTATADIKDVKGKILIRRGTRVNALSKMPFTRSVIVYDPNRRRERVLATRLRKDAIRRGKKPVMIITRPEESSFQSIFDEEKKVGDKVYLLSKALAKRMQIIHTVSVVEAEGTHFIVKEFAATGEK